MSENRPSTAIFNPRRTARNPQGEPRAYARGCRALFQQMAKCRHGDALPHRITDPLRSTCATNEAAGSRSLVRRPRAVNHLQIRFDPAILLRQREPELKDPHQAARHGVFAVNQATAAVLNSTSSSRITLSSPPSSSPLISKTAVLNLALRMPAANGSAF